MSKELITILSHLLNKVDHDWMQNKEIVDAMLSLKDKKRFEAPTLQEVTNELKALKVRNYQQQADKFWNFYESKNWMVGKNKMKSWKASIKTWEFEKDNLIL
jgi:hypothetical protein